MKLININQIFNYEDVFLSRMRVDLRERMQNSEVFIIVSAKDKDNVISCDKAILMRDSNGLCKTKEYFDQIDFEIIDNKELHNYLPEYFIGKNICSVNITDDKY